MAPILHLVRHAQGEHNKGGDAYLIRDPVLIKSGLDECRMLSEQFPYHSSIDLIVSSPLRRSLYTALEAFKPAIARGVKVVALPELQETSDIACDTGTEVSELAREFSVELGPSGPVVDLSLLKPGWWVKKGKYAPSSSALIARAKDARQWLRARPEKEIVVVGHGGFFHYLTEDWTGVGDSEHASAWENTEFRTYRFVSDDDENASIIETEKSRADRGVTGRIPSRDEQRQLYLKVMQYWEDQGFQNPLKMEG
ncbi:hypothetical protein DTO217A2_3461 [Paecilomyces variotii]|nr:hypothetical protein DTO217A2_3461 [Paecilomyces variotii]